jgi:multiple antibiotic resistance protein
VLVDTHSVTLYGIQHSVYVRFSLLALSSILFLVDPFAALPTFLAVTHGYDAQRRRSTAFKASLTALILLSSFAFAGEYIFRLFGITLPAFEIAGGIIPMLAGPGAITSVMVLVGQAQTHWQMAAILISIAITALICYLVLGNSDKVARMLGETGIRILVRIMGLLLVALAVQYFVNGLADLNVIAKPNE